MYLLGSLCIAITGDRSYIPYFLKLYAELFLDLYIVCAFLLILPTKIRNIAQWILSVFFYIITLIDIFCYIRIGSTFSPSILRLIIETNTTEATGFLSTYITPSLIISPISLVITIFIFQVCFSRKISMLIRLKKYKTIICIVIIFILAIGLWSAVKNKKYIVQTWKYDSISKIENYFATEYYASRAQYLPIYRLLFAFYANNLAEKQIEQVFHTLQVAEIDSCKFTSPNIILIIGESYNKYHSQLYGYSLETTPHQSHWNDELKLFVFNDAVTPYNITSDVLKNALSLNDLSQQEEWSEKPLFTTLFKKAGYHVSFISNEFVMKQQEGFADFSGGFFLNNSQLSKLQFDCRNTSTHPYDEELLNDYQELSKYNTEHNLIIFSLMGQHVDYRDQCPIRFKHFITNNYQRDDLTESEIQIIADYDNATRYNDYIISQIVQLFDDKDVIIIYMPDHGEECYDEIRTFGRLHDENISKDIAKNEFSIPFWIYCTDKYIELHHDMTELIKTSVNNRFYSDDLPHLLLYLAGISCKDYDERNNVISSNYNKKRKRLLRGKTNYDELMRK